MTTSIDVVMATDENYAGPLAAVATSIGRFLPRDTGLNAHVLHNGLATETRAEIARCVEKTGNVHFHGVSNAMTVDWSQNRSLSYLNDSTLLRLHLDDCSFGDAARVMYLDCDVLVNADLSELFCRDMEGKTVAAVPDEFTSDGNVELKNALGASGVSLGLYFNCGVLMVDLGRWRARDVGYRAKAVLESNPWGFRFADQDALNFVLHDDWSQLPASWNRLVSVRRGVPSGRAAGEVLKNSRIIHFVGGTKPWHAEYPAGLLKDRYAKTAADSGWRSRPGDVRGGS